MGINVKLETIVISALVASLVVCYFVFAARIKRADAEVIKYKTDAAVWENKCLRAEAAVETQNAAIEKVRVDTVMLVSRIKEVEIKYRTKRDTVIKSIERDGSCENQISNINNMLRVFSGR